MKFLISALVSLACVSIAGCVSTQLVPDENAIRSVRKISIIPVETLPFVINGSSAQQSAMDPYIKSSTLLMSVPINNVPTGGMILTSVFGIAMLIEAGSSGIKAPGDQATIEKAIAELWMPTVEFAKYAKLKLDSSFEVNLTEFYYKLPVTDRTTTWHMENWLGPFRRWYNEDVSSVDYAMIADNSNAVLEVGLGNYEYYAGKLLMQVHLKLVDPKTKMAIGRCRVSSHSDIGDITKLLSQNGFLLKNAIIANGDELTDKCLIELHLLH